MSKRLNLIKYDGDMTLKEYHDLLEENLNLLLNHPVWTQEALNDPKRGPGKIVDNTMKRMEKVEFVAHQRGWQTTRLEAPMGL